MRVTNWKVLLALAKLVGVFAIDTADDHEHDQGDGGDSQSSSSDGRIVQSLFRFPATQLGPEFGELLQMWHSEWLHADADDTGSTQTQHLPKITPESSGTNHALYSVATPAATLFRRQCYSPAPIETKAKHNLYKNFEQQRKAISFQYMKDSVEEMKLIHTMTKRFYPAFTMMMHLGNKNDQQQQGGARSSSSDNGNAASTRRMHKKKSKSTVDTIYAQTTLPSDYDSPSKLAFQTVTSNEDNMKNNNKQTIQQQWAWHPPAHFSSRGVPNNMSFRVNMYKSMRNALQTKIQQQVLQPDFEFDHGRQSGMFWYPPGGVREWHSNYLDLVGNTRQKQKKRDNGSSTAAEKTKEEEIFASQVWRMYFVRTTRDEKFDKKLAKLKKKHDSNERSSSKISSSSSSNNDHSAMHIIPGKDSGITLDVLQKAGARLLSEEEKKRQWSDEFAEDDIPPIIPSTGSAAAAADNAGGDDYRNSVWRVPDQDGYVTLFRIPDLYHCIASEEVHRYSLGFAFSDKEVQALLTLAGVEFDVVKTTTTNATSSTDDGKKKAVVDDVDATIDTHDDEL